MKFLFDFWWIAIVVIAVAIGVDKLEKKYKMNSEKFATMIGGLFLGAMVISFVCWVLHLFGVI